jgi:vacuolar-type H+-ATPase subunit E/Vma4
MTIEEKMEHFRRLSLESANSKSADSINSYKQTMDDELEFHKESATRLAEESKKARLNQVRATSKKDLASAQMMIKKDLTNKQSEIKTKVFELVREKISAYRKTPDYTNYLINQIKGLLAEYGNFNITIYIDPEDSALLENLNFLEVQGLSSLKKISLLTILLKAVWQSNRNNLRLSKEIPKWKKQVRFMELMDRLSI